MKTSVNFQLRPQLLTRFLTSKQSRLSLFMLLEMVRRIEPVIGSIPLMHCLGSFGCNEFAKHLARGFEGYDGALLLISVGASLLQMKEGEEIGLFCLLHLEAENFLSREGQRDK